MREEGGEGGGGRDGEKEGGCGGSSIDSHISLNGLYSFELFLIKYSDKLVYNF